MYGKLDFVKIFTKFYIRGVGIFLTPLLFFPAQEKKSPCPSNNFYSGRERFMMGQAC